MFAPLSLKQLRENAKFQSKEARENAKMESDENRKQQLQQIKLQEAAAKANQGLTHKEDLHAVKLKELGSPLGKTPRMNKQKLGIPTQNPMAGTGVLGQGQKRLYAEGTDTVPAMLTPGEAVIPAPAAQDPDNKPLIKQMIEEGREANAEANSEKSSQPTAYSNGTTRVPSMQQQMFGNIPKISAIKPARKPSKMHYYNDGTTSAGGFMDTMMQGLRRVAPGIGMMIDGVPNAEVPQVSMPQVSVETPTQPVMPTVPVKNYIGNTTNPQAAAERGAALSVPPVVDTQAETARLLSNYPASSTVTAPVQVPTPVVPYSNPAANQTTAYSPKSDINQMDLYDVISSAESGSKPRVKNPLSSASGPVQFTKDTWNGIRKQVPELANIEYGSEGFFNPANQKLAFNYSVSQNDTILAKNNIEPNTVNRYVMHGLGSGDGARVLSNPTADFRETLNKSSRKNNADLIMSQNPVYAKFKTNQDYIDWAEGHLKKQAGIGRDSSTVPPKPTNVDPTQPEAVEVGTPTMLQNVPPVAAAEPSPMPPEQQNAAIAKVAQENTSYFEQALAAMKSANLPPEKQKEEAISLVQQVYGDKGIFNQSDLLRFAITAAGGMVTGGSTAGSLRYAAKDTLYTADRRRAEQVAAERQQKSFDQQNTMADKRAIQSAVLQTAAQKDRDAATDKRNAIAEARAGVAAMVKEGISYQEAKAWYDGGMKGPQPSPKPSFIRSGNSELVTLTQPINFGGKTLKPGEPIYSYTDKDRVTGETRPMFLIGDKPVSETEAAKRGIFVRKWNDSSDGSKAKIDDIMRWTDNSSKTIEGILENTLGASNIKGKANPSRAGQITSGEASEQAKSWVLSKGYDISDARSKNELDKITSIATRQMTQDIAAGSKVRDITPYLNASYIKDRSGLSDKLFTLDSKTGKQMNPEKIASLPSILVNAGYKDQAQQASQLQMLSKLWAENQNNIQRRYKDSDSETGFYMFVTDALKKTKPK